MLAEGETLCPTCFATATPTPTPPPAAPSPTPTTTLPPTDTAALASTDGALLPAVLFFLLVLGIAVAIGVTTRLARR